MFKYFPKSFCLALSLLTLSANSKTVPVNNAELVAGNFIKQNSGDQTLSLKLFYTAKATDGAPLYFVFNLNNDHGFVIVAADDAAKPIIGYSLQDNFTIPDPRSNIGFWLNKRSEEINFLRTNNLNPTFAISQIWYNYVNNINGQQRLSSTASVAPLLITLWNQSPYYNDLCPGGSVTGCVATTMAQIMKYWAYPLHGTGSSSYNENDYGNLSANYGAATYNYSLMTNTLPGPNPEVAKLMYDCGVSVDMDYSPSGSGAFVICSDNPISAQHSYTAYFGYDPNQILGVHRSDYSDNTWHSMLKGDLNVGRPIQYAGFGPDGGHTWVCDGYDVNNFYHMNWGWGGSANGYFDVDVLNPNGMDFSQGEQAVFGIVPKPVTSVDAGVLNITPNDIVCNAGTINPIIQIRNYGSTPLTACTINYKIDNQNYQTLNWTGSIVTGQTSTVQLTGNNLSAGSHTFTSYTSGPNNITDPNLTNDMSSALVSLISPDQLPLVDGFETQSTFDQWSVLPSTGSDWNISSQASSSGAKSRSINNLANTPGNTSILQGLSDYDLSSANGLLFEFKVAYQQKTATSNDKLKLEVSNDCGKTWKTRWQKAGDKLASTTALSSSPYLPTPADFVTHTVTIPYYFSAIFRFVFVSDDTDPGNNIFLDDVNLKDLTVGVQEIGQMTIGSSLYPNPAKDKVTLEYNTNESHRLSIDVCDVLGKKLITLDKGKLEAGNHEFDINTSEFKNGVYFVSITVNGNRIVKRLVIQN